MISRIQIISKRHELNERNKKGNLVSKVSFFVKTFSRLVEFAARSKREHGALAGVAVGARVADVADLGLSSNLDENFNRNRATRSIGEVQLGDAEIAIVEHLSRVGKNRHRRLVVDLDGARIRTVQVGDLGEGGNATVIAQDVHNVVSISRAGTKGEGVAVSGTVLGGVVAVD